MKDYLMYIKFLFTALVFVSLLSFCKKSQSPAKTNQYLITKIDSLNNFYLIYAMRNDSTFKIAEEKVKMETCTSIQVKQLYSLKLKSRIFMGKSGKSNITKATNDLVKCVGVDSVTTICLDDNCVRDLFYSENLNGLCYKNN